MTPPATTANVHKSRGLSPFRGRRGQSPTPPPTKSRGKSPLRSLSPFHRHDSFDEKQKQQHPTSSGNNKRPNVLVCHESAHAIVFRDHLRLARKIIQEVEGEDDEEDEEVDVKNFRDLDSVDSASSGSDSDSDSDDDDAGEGAFQSMRQSIRQSVRASLRDSLTLEQGQDLVHELNHMAHQSQVPELQHAQFQFANVSERNVEIEGLHAHICPLEDLEYKAPNHEFVPLLMDVNAHQPNVSNSGNDDGWTPAELQVFEKLQQQKACVKTIKNSEWPSFLKRFLAPKPQTGFKHAPSQHDDIPPRNGFPFNSFVTSTTLLPEGGRKMRCYGTSHAYNVGVVFDLPDMPDELQEEQAQQDTHTWSWPAGYAAKTEFNISHGKLINGRQEALAPLRQLRQYNHEYLHNTDHFIAGKIIKGGFNVVPYNEIYLRVGGRGRIVEQKDIVTGEDRNDLEGTGRSFELGVGLFSALFIRSLTMGDLIALFRTRARIAHVLGQAYVNEIPLLYIDHEHGVRVLTQSLQRKFWKMATHKLQPFKNPILAPTLSYYDTNETTLHTKLEELLDLSPWQTALNHQELARIAGGFGATDSSIVDLLYRHRFDPKELQEIMTAGLASAIRAQDHYTARQLLLLYCLQAGSNAGDDKKAAIAVLREPATTYSNLSVLKQNNGKSLGPLPPPIDTKRLRRATNSDGLLLILGAAQILKTMSTGSAKRRTQESYEAVEEWVKHGEDSVSFRIASWKQQKADEADSNIAMAKDSRFMAFVTNKSVHNRKHFAQHLREAAPADGFTCVRFLQVIYEIVANMHSPCMRLELLQFILGLDNRYSVTLIKESIELAATCLSVVGH